MRVVGQGRCRIKHTGVHIQHTYFALLSPRPLALPLPRVERYRFRTDGPPSLPHSAHRLPCAYTLRSCPVHILIIICPVQCPSCPSCAVPIIICPVHIPSYPANQHLSQRDISPLLAAWPITVQQAPRQKARIPTPHCLAHYSASTLPVARICPPSWQAR